MSNKVILKRGFCTKSPPKALHRWRTRFCTLSRESVPDMEEFHGKYNKHYDKNRICNFDPSLEYLVFSYYKDEEDEAKENCIKKFIIDSSWNSAVFDYPIGVEDHKYVIKLLLGPLYFDREMFLCFEEKEEHRQWLQAFDSCPDKGTMETLELIEQELNIPVQKYKPPSVSSLQMELDQKRLVVFREYSQKLVAKSHAGEGSDSESLANTEKDQGLEAAAGID